MSQHQDPSVGSNKPQVFAVLDGAAFANLPRELVQRGASAQCLYSGSLAPDVFANAPWLVVFSDAASNDPVARWIYTEGIGRSWGIFGQYAGDLKSLHYHLRTLNLVVMPNGSHVLFRWYDPRVLEDIIPLLEPIQLARLYGPILTFAIPLHDGEFSVHKRPHTDQQLAPGSGLLTITQKQLAALDDQAEQRFKNAIATELTQAYPETFDKRSPKEIESMVTNGLQRARSHGLSWESSLAGFLHLMAGIGPDFDQQPTIAALLSRQEMAPDHRFRLLFRYVPSREWKVASRSSRWTL